MSSEVINSASERLEPPTPNELIIAGLDRFENRINDAAQAVGENPGLYSNSKFPEGFSTVGDFATINLLKEEDYDINLFVRYTKLFVQAQDVYQSFSGVAVKPENILAQLINRFPNNIAHHAFAIEDSDGELHALVRGSLNEKISSHSSLETEINFLQRANGLARPIELLKKGNGSDPYADEVRQLLLNHEGILWLHYIESPYKDIPQQDPIAWLKAKQEAKRVWMRDVVLTATDITDPEIADNYVYASSRNEGSGERDLPEIIKKIETFGLEKLANISEFSGIYALADVNEDQLERMWLLATGDQQEIKRLAEHDVQVLFVNRMGDHNNVLRKIPGLVDDPNRRTAVFETQGLHDIYRYMGALHTLGVWPSQLIFAHHGDIGQAPIVRKPQIGNTDNVMQIATIHARAFVDNKNADPDKESEFTGYSMHGMKGFARIVDEYMQDGRGKDCADEAVGNREIVFISCYSDTDSKVKSYDQEQDAEVEMPDASISSRLADDLLFNNVRSSVIIYASDNGIRVQETPKGFIYTVLPEDFEESRKNGTLARAPVDASRFEVAHGQIMKSKVSQVPLRNFNKTA